LGPTAEAVKAVVEEMELELGGTEVLIVQCMDNSCFFLMDEETGAMALPSLGEKNIYHAVGQLVVAKDQQLEHLLNKLAPICEWRPEMLIILLTPFCRFLTSCCEKHPKTMEEALKEGAVMLRSLGELRRKVKTWLVFNKYTNVVMVDPLATFNASADAAAAINMMADTVHLKGSGYRAVAQKCKQVITDWLLGKKRKATAEASNVLAKKPKVEGTPQSEQAGSKAGGTIRKSNEPVKGRKGKQLAKKP